MDEEYFAEEDSGGGPGKDSDHGAGVPVLCFGPGHGTIVPQRLSEFFGEDISSASIPPLHGGFLCPGFMIPSSLFAGGLSPENELALLRVFREFSDNGEKTPPFIYFRSDAHPWSVLTSPLLRGKKMFLKALREMRYQTQTSPPPGYVVVFPGDVRMSGTLSASPLDGRVEVETYTGWGGEKTGEAVFSIYDGRVVKEKGIPQWALVDLYNIIRDVGEKLWDLGGENCTEAPPMGVENKEEGREAEGVKNAGVCHLVWCIPSTEGGHTVRVIWGRLEQPHEKSAEQIEVEPSDIKNPVPASGGSVGVRHVDKEIGGVDTGDIFPLPIRCSVGVWSDFLVRALQLDTSENEIGKNEKRFIQRRVLDGSIVPVVYYDGEYGGKELGGLAAEKLFAMIPLEKVYEDLSLPDRVRHRIRETQWGDAADDAVKVEILVGVDVPHILSVERVFSAVDGVAVMVTDTTEDGIDRLFSTLGPVAERYGREKVFIAIPPGRQSIRQPMGYLIRGVVRTGLGGIILGRDRETNTVDSVAGGVFVSLMRAVYLIAREEWSVVVENAVEKKREEKKERDLHGRSW